MSDKKELIKLIPEYTELELKYNDTVNMSEVAKNRE